MPYDDIYNFNDVSFDDFNDSNDNFIDNVEVGSEDVAGKDETEFDGFSDFKSNESNSDVSNELDYTTYLEDLLSNQEIIITNQESIISLDQEIVNNGHRLYYFVGGLYVAFAIIIMVKFFKTFLF